MAHRIEVSFKSGFVDALGNAVQKRINEDLGIKVNAVQTIKVYTLGGELSLDQLTLLGRELFADPVIQTFSVDRPKALELPWDFLIEVGRKPGVTDNEGRTAGQAIKEIVGNVCTCARVHVDTLKIYTSRQYLISGGLNHEDAERIGKELLANELIERFFIIERRTWDGKIAAEVPAVKLKHAPNVAIIDLELPDEELLKISAERVLALNGEEMQIIREYFRRHEDERKGLGLPAAPTDVELEALAQNWSEHCKHKIFKGVIEYRENGKMMSTKCIDSLFDTYIRGATEAIDKEWLVSVFADNAGVIKFNQRYNLTFKVETHNSPSALEPYGGAITGIVGVNRDPLGTGLGSRLIFNTDVFCFADPDYDKKLPKGVLHPKRIFEGVRKGVEDGGNKSGIPTVNGAIRFDDRYLGQPLVYCGTGGIMPADVDGKPSHEKQIAPGELIVMVGGRIGKDGIHGATFSSAGLHEKSPTSAVQIGDPFTQKVMADFLIEARDRGLYKAIQDNGAGGLSSSVAELAPMSGGCEIYLDKAPLKYEGLDPWEILLSESQERMTLAVSPQKLEEFTKLAEDQGVEATAIGKFTDTGRFQARYKDKTVAYLDLNFLLEGYPQKTMVAHWKPPQHEEPNFEQPRNLTRILHKMLSRLNICSKEYVIRQYDHEVQGGAIVKPLVGRRNDGPSDAAVIWPIEAMRDGFKQGIVVSNGINPNYGDIDTYHMAACCVDEAIRNAVAVGADPDRVALLDNFSWSSSDDPFRLAQLVRACRALYDCATVFGAPFISGKDSMYNDFEGELDGKRVKLSVPPTLLISALVIIEDVGKAVTVDLKRPGDLIYILGETYDELGGSEYYALMGEEIESQPALRQRYIGNKVPKVNPHVAKELYQALHRAMEEGLVKACHDLSEGGLAVAAAEMAFAGELGMELFLAEVPGAQGIGRDDLALFSESPSRLLVEIRPENKERFERIISGCTCSLVGETTSDKRLVINGLEAKEVISEEVERLKESWKRPLDW